MANPDRVSAMLPTQHVALASMLIAANGGLETAAQKCRVNKSQLAYYQRNELALSERPFFMPADVIVDLERGCGQRLYSQAMVALITPSSDRLSLIESGCATVEAATAVLKQIRKAAADGVITPRERRAGHHLLQVLSQHIADLAAALDSGCGS